MLVVVENRDIHPLLQAVFNFKTLRRLDVFEVDAAKRRLQRGDRFDKFLRVGLIHFNIKDINPGELLEEHALAFHDGFTGERADIAKPQHGRAVGNHRDQIGAGGEVIGLQRVGFNRLTGIGNPRRIGERQIALVVQRLGRGDGNLACGRKAVITQGFFFQRIAHVEISKGLRKSRVSLTESHKHGCRFLPPKRTATGVYIQDSGKASVNSLQANSRCRRASNSITPQATETLRLSMPSAIGICTRKSHCSRRPWRMPSPSLPTMTASGTVKSVA